MKFTETAKTTEFVKGELEGRTAILTMNRPKALNALNDQTLNELERLFTSIREDKEVLAVILTGEGRAFAAGADISQMSGYGVEEGRLYSERAQRLFHQIEILEKPVIAAVNGFALGGGCELSMSCDIRIASENAVFGQPEAKLGLIPCFGGTQRLPRLVGTGIAKELIYTCRQVKAQEAREIGLVNRVVSAEELMPEARAVTEKILANSPLAIAYCKTAINRGTDTDLGNGLEIEKECWAVVFGSKDSREGIRAFLEKRAPQFQNEY